VGKRLAQSLMWVAVLSFVTGCASMTDREKCILLYSGGGALGAGAIGTGVMLSKHDEDQYLWAVGAGVGGGALLGAIAGYFLCAEAPPPPDRSGAPEV